MSVGTLAAALDPNAPRPYKGAAREYQQSVIITITGNYATDGVVVDLTGLNTPGLNAPYRSQLVSGGTTPTGQTYIYRAGTDRSDGKIMSFAGATQDSDDSSWPDTTIKATFWYKVNS
jgi:hypothetical protein